MLPQDWHAVAEDEHIYFVTGSALNVRDLDRAGFRTASAIAIGRCHQKPSEIHAAGKAGKIADARAILATTVIENQFTRSTPPPVITDLAYDGSVSFLPQSQNMQLAMSHIKTRPPRRAAGSGTSFIELPSMTGQQVSTAKSMRDANSLGHVAFEEDYDILEAAEYSNHPRFMAGIVFCTSIMTALVANSMHNRSMISSIGSLLSAPFVLLTVPFVWQGQNYADLCEWLLVHRNLLSLGIYRNSASCAENEIADSNNKRPSLYFMFTCPPAYSTTVTRSDRILCLVPEKDH